MGLVAGMVAALAIPAAAEDWRFYAWYSGAAPRLDIKTDWPRGKPPYAWAVCRSNRRNVRLESRTSAW